MLPPIDNHSFIVVDFTVPVVNAGDGKMSRKSLYLERLLTVTRVQISWARSGITKGENYG